MIVPDEIGEPVTGWRVWIVDIDPDGGPWLTSVIKSCRWPKREPLEAACLGGPGLPHTSPTLDDCDCGIYALPGPHGIAEFCGNYQPRVIGTVRLWGRILEGSDGWRGQFAFPARLWVVRSTSRATDRMPVVHYQLRRAGRVAAGLERNYRVAASVIDGGAPEDILRQLRIVG